jgi:phosphoribosyl 1,2-cyclic phosphate phosphodiesterase
MEFVILGTAAAEAWPAPFCRCSVCVRARELGGRDIRSRSGALLDGVVKIDFGPDTYAQMQNTGRDIFGITSLIFTHQHDDHISANQLMYRHPPFVRETTPPILDIYGNEPVVEIINEELKCAGCTDKDIRARLAAPLVPFTTVTTADGTEILPLPADHVEKALVLRLARKGRTIFYGHDSGSYSEETVQALKGVPLDIALFDCTNGTEPSNNRGHMGVDGVLLSIDRLRAVGAVTSGTQLVATHFSHNGCASYAELRSFFDPHGIAVAFDGIKFDL